MKKFILMVVISVPLLMVVILALLFVLAYCGRFNSSELQGQYVAEYPFGSDRIYLKKDGMYSQQVWFTDDSVAYKTSGEWKFDSTDNYLTIENAIRITDNFGEKSKIDCCPPRNGSSIHPVWRTLFFGKINFGFDEGVHYSKISEE